MEFIFNLCQSNFRTWVLTLMQRFTVYKACFHHVSHLISTTYLSVRVCYLPWFPCKMKSTECRDIPKSTQQIYGRPGKDSLNPSRNINWTPTMGQAASVPPGRCRLAGDTGNYNTVWLSVILLPILLFLLWYKLSGKVHSWQCPVQQMLNKYICINVYRCITTLWVKI